MSPDLFVGKEEFNLIHSMDRITIYGNIKLKFYKIKNLLKTIPDDKTK